MNRERPKKLVVLSPAKLNLCLFVLRKREDGYHDIISFVSKISLYDEIEISFLNTEERKDEIIFTPRWGIPERNTISETVDEIRKVLSIGRVRVEVRKKIPPGSGLGGASSNSASCIKAFFGESSKSVSALHIAEKIGADVPLFLARSPCVIEGKGEKIAELEIKGIEKMYFIVVWNGIISKTSDVYRLFDELYHKKGDKQKKIAQKRNEFISYLRSLTQKKLGDIRDVYHLIGYNDLEEAFLYTYPEAREFKKELEKFGKFFLTGSGSAFFSVHEKYEDAEKLAEELSKHFRYIFLTNHVR